MKKVFLLLLTISSSLIGFCQITGLTEKSNLPSTVSESSGLIYFDGRLITHNDSGSTNMLFEIDSISGAITRTVIVNNAVNVDWEALAQDSTHIYIGDIGNNSGSRTDLKIYKIDKNDYLNSTNVSAEVINFSYSDQVSFSPNPNNTEWDSETIISLDSNLVIITKDWVTESSKAYTIPKTTGAHSALPMATILNNSGLITDAAYNPVTSELYLVGYNNILQPFLWIGQNVLENDLFAGVFTQIWLPSLGFEQIEAIAEVAPDRYFMTSEAYSIPPLAESAKLICFSSTEESSSLEEMNFQNWTCGPNPVIDKLHIAGPDFTAVNVYNINGELVLSGSEPNIDAADLASGVYMVEIYTSTLESQIIRIVKE